MPDYKIILPSETRTIKEDGNKGVYEVRGLYPGYGHTLGNSIRRIILSSLPGSTITSVKIDGVPHEFDTIDGIKEDVINIILNLKKLRFKMFTDEPLVATLSVSGQNSGQKEVTGADISLPGQIEILNPDQTIATITSKNTNLDIEVTIEKGLGYVTKEALQKNKTGIGIITLDAAFSPIRRVNYEVENMRVGDRTDYNKLTISLETDGTISPYEALETAIGIMISQLKAIVCFKECDDNNSEKGVAGEEGVTEDNKEEGKVDTDKEHTEEAIGGGDDVLKTRIDTLNLSTRTTNALDLANVRTIGGLVRKKEKDILALDGLGEKGLKEIKDALAKFDIQTKT